MPEIVRTLKLEHEATFFGPNPFSTNPVIVARIGPSDGDPLVSAEAWMQGCLVLSELFPEWVDAPGPSVQDPLAIIARTAARWSLAVLNETVGFLHDAGAVPIGSGARLWIGFHRPDISVSALRLAFSVLAEAARSQRIDRSRVDSALQTIWRLCVEHHPDHQARVLMQGARARDIPVLPFMTGSRFWQYGWGCRSRVFLETSSNADGHLGNLLERSKVFSKMVFAEIGVPTPEHRLVTRASELPEAIRAVGWPCVVKPVSRGGGKGVTAGIKTLSEAEAAFAVARQYSDEPIMIEAFVPGGDHRIMVIDGRFFAAIRREPASVTGDGRNTIAQLIAALNVGRSKNRVKSHHLPLILVDEVVEQHLQRQGVHLDTVLETGRRVTLRGNANWSTGGVCLDVTADVHPHTRQMAETVARAMGLATTGIDLVTTDIGKPWHECGALIEINISPGVSGLIAAGLDALSVASAILGTAPARIPVRLVVAPRSELPHALDRLRNLPSAAGFGWASDGEATLDGMPLGITPSAPWQAVETLLRHRVLQRACLLCSVEAIVRHGMPVDKVESTTLFRCSVPLPAAWMKVLGERSGTVSWCSDWTDLKLAEFATSMLAPG